MKGMLKGKKGITLIALVITVILLIILAGVAISLVVGDNGIASKARQGAKQYGEEADREAIALLYQRYYIDELGESKSFVEYLQENGYDIESNDATGNTGTLITGGKKYIVAVVNGKVTT